MEISDICNDGVCHIERAARICLGEYPLLVYIGFLRFWFGIGVLCFSDYNTSRESDILFQIYLPNLQTIYLAAMWKLFGWRLI